MKRRFAELPIISGIFDRKAASDMFVESVSFMTNHGPKLHLGCGENYFEGYINVDLPPSRHTVMRTKPDLYADLKEIRFPIESIALIRNHHVFEHFDRPTSLAMLVEWYGWLKEDGILIIETPDFKQAAKRVLSMKGSIEGKLVPLRHLFGSHEASWAYHLDGWYKEKFDLFLKALGYRDIRFHQFSDRNLDNIIVKAHKRRPFVTLDCKLSKQKSFWRIR